MADNNPYHIVLIAGEASGDLYGAKLVTELRKRNGNISFSGMGGRNMKNAGVDCIATIDKMGVVGLWEVLAEAKNLLKTYFQIKNHIKRTRPDLIIPIDYPDFNLRLTRYAKKIKVPVLYYISPQLWAWRTGRINIIRNNVDRMVVILPFETEFYRQHGLEVEYFGHPLMDDHMDPWTKSEARQKLTMNLDTRVVCCMPGSRKSELRSHLPVILKAVEKIKSSLPSVEFLLLLAPTLTSDDLIKCGYQSGCMKVCTDLHEEYLTASDIVITASGTATIQVALAKVPMIIIYKVAPLTYWIGKQLIRTPHIGMVNLIAGKRIVPELIQEEANADSISQKVLETLNNKDIQQKIKTDLTEIEGKLGTPGASGRTAQYILEFLNQKNFET